MFRYQEEKKDNNYKISIHVM